VLFAVFFWTFLCGLFGTCDQHPSSRWLADLLGGPANTKTGKL
jgi:AI-2 transport protein TqsA